VSTGGKKTSLEDNPEPQTSKKPKSGIVKTEKIERNGHLVDLDFEKGKSGLCPVVIVEKGQIRGLCMRQLKRNACPIHKSIK
jgi:hypothetical protein